MLSVFDVYGLLHQMMSTGSNPPI